jgi:hypothetical protein
VLTLPKLNDWYGIILPQYLFPTSGCKESPDGPLSEKELPGEYSVFSGEDQEYLLSKGTI